jgi:concentrative nucleoside transporter, CNT family
MDHNYIGLLGIVVVLGIAFLFSKDRKAIKWNKVLIGLGLQFAFAIALVGIPSMQVPGVFRVVFDVLNQMVTGLVDFTNEGSKFLFGPLAEIRDPWGFVFAFRALPTIVFFSAVMSGLYYLGILQKVVKLFAIVMQKTMGTSGAETLSTSANIFVGQTEAPLLVKPYIPTMTRSEIYCVMVGGMATIAAGVEGAYVGMLKGRISDIAGHLITASVLGSIGALIISKIIIPETDKPLTSGQIKLPDDEKIDVNVLESVSRGASEGISLALNVGAMLVVFISLIALVDALLMKIGVWINFSEPLTFSFLAGKALQPMAWVLGVPWEEAGHVGGLLGKKIILNEFVGFLGLSSLGTLISDRSAIIAAYALCGFANISSIGIQIGGIGAIAGKNKIVIAQMGLLAVIGGNLACFLSACIAGLLF